MSLSTSHRDHDPPAVAMVNDAGPLLCSTALNQRTNAGDGQAGLVRGHGLESLLGGGRGQAASRPHSLWWRDREVESARAKGRRCVGSQRVAAECMLDGARHSAGAPAPPCGPAGPRTTSATTATAPTLARAATRTSGSLTEDDASATGSTGAERCSHGSADRTMNPCALDGTDQRAMNRQLAACVDMPARDRSTPMAISL